MTIVRTPNYPFADPQNRHEARENAKWFAVQGMYDGSLAWAAIAEVFSADSDVEVMMADDQPVAQAYDPGWAEKVIEDLDDTAVIGVSVGAGSTAVANPSGHALDGSTIVVEAALYDVLRVLATRYVLTGLDNQPVTVDLDSPEVTRPPWSFKITRMPTSGHAHCWVEPSA